MADIKDLRIRKRTYQFGLKRRYSSERKYKKVEKTPLQRIKEAVEAWRKPKGKIVLEDEGEEKKGTMALEQKAKKKESKPHASQ